MPEYVDSYFDWLCELINLRYDQYEILIRELYSIDYIWVRPLDSDRAEDGLILRKTYHSSQGFSGSLDDKPCSVLEVLITLAQAMNFILDDDDRGDRTRIWFWELIKNLGLTDFTNVKIEQSSYSILNTVRYICEIWMLRQFQYDGRGSPFPLRHPYEDQRSLDMVRQLNAYVLENYITDDEIL